MVRIIKRTWTHPQDVNFIQWCFVMAELHESRPPPVGLFNIKILHVEHHHSSQNESNQLCSWPIHKQPNIYVWGVVGLRLVDSSGVSAKQDQEDVVVVAVVFLISFLSFLFYLPTNKKTTKHTKNQYFIFLVVLLNRNGKP